MNSRIIFVDGISGAGKGTQIPFIERYLQGKGYDVLTVREPSSFLDGISREYKRREDRSGMVATLLFAADRLHQYEHTIVPFLADHPQGIVLSDRSKLSSVVYQAEQGVPVEDIVHINRFYPDADLSLLLLCEPDIAIARIDRRGERSVDEELVKIRRLKQRYEALARNTGQRIVRSDGDPEAIQAQLRSHLNTFLGVPQEKVVFLDKDGTLVDNSGYPGIIPTDAIYYEHTVNGLRALQEGGYKLILISSQPWVARGRMTADEVEATFQSVTRKYADVGITIEGYKFCPHHRVEGGCRCKKPNTLLLEQIADTMDVDIANSFFVGDMGIDIDCGRNFGLRTVLVETSSAADRELGSEPTHRCADVNAAAEWILSKA